MLKRTLYIQWSNKAWGNANSALTAANVCGHSGACAWNDAHFSHHTLNYKELHQDNLSVSCFLHEAHALQLPTPQGFLFLPALLLTCGTEMAKRALGAIAASLCIQERTRHAVAQTVTCRTLSGHLRRAQARLCDGICEPQDGGLKLRWWGARHRRNCICEVQVEDGWLEPRWW